MATAATDRNKTFTDREYVIGYGENGYGEGFYGGSRVVNNITDVRDNWPLVLGDLHQDPFDSWLRTLTSELYRLDVAIDQLYDQRFLTTATGRELDKIAEPLGATREMGESDNELRYRTQLVRVARTSEGTLDDVVRLLEVAFGEDASQCSIEPVSDEPAIIVRVPEAFFDEYPINETTFEEIVEMTTPALDGVGVTTSSLFTFAGSKSGAGWDEGEWFER